ncbi:MAG TPA: cupin domain-containing protein [Steroidobacteraceae bacterium]|nr:cupin domain-containing protein [Steroidobacteraceae bacterium]
MRRDVIRAGFFVGSSALAALLISSTLGFGRASAEPAPPATPAAIPASAAAKAPMLLNKLMRSRSGFKTLPPWPKSMVKRGDEHHAMREVYVGEFAVSVYEATDGLVVLTDQPYDELVNVVHGECILTPNGGEPQRFKAGDIFIVPKGFSGGWEGKAGFRELIVVETQAYKRAVAAFFPADAH